MCLFFSLIFILILVLTALKEIKKLDALLGRFPVAMQYIPTWSFFAPNPNIHDYHLLYRTISNDGAVQDWVHAYSVEERPLRCFLWHPEKNFSKAFLDVALELIQFSSKTQDKRQICASLPYLHLLSFLDSLPILREKIQFMILTNSRIYDYEIAFLSEVHPLTKR